MTMYYKAIKLFKDEAPVITYWYGDSNKAGAIAHLLYSFDFIIPAGSTKPKNVSRETIMEF